MKARRTWLMRLGENVWSSPIMKFCARLGMSSAKARNAGKSGTGERFVQSAVGKTVSTGQGGSGREGMIDADVEAVIAVAQNRR